MIYEAATDELLQNVWDGKRINQAQALRLYHLPLAELGALADRRRQLARAEAYGGRGNQIVTYSGEIPKYAALLKNWLSKQLEIPEKKILEGVLAIG